jgi:hypothetical protein
MGKKRSRGLSARIKKWHWPEGKVDALCGSVSAGGWQKEARRAKMRKMLDENERLFQILETQPPAWWKALLADRAAKKDLYIDIRPGSINVYYRGGSLMKLTYSDQFRAAINTEYIPLSRQNEQVQFQFTNDTIRIDETSIAIASADNFSEWLAKIKRRMYQMIPYVSENAIKAGYVLSNDWFIDTEFVRKGSKRKEHTEKGDKKNKEDLRFDLVWLDVKQGQKTLHFVELKTIGDSRIYPNKEKEKAQPPTEGKPNVEEIHDQLEKYRDCLTREAEQIRKHYQVLFRIKKALGILPAGCVGLTDLDDVTIETRPVFLVGDCTENWIKHYMKEIKERIKGTVSAAFFQGRNTSTFSIPKSGSKSERQVFYGSDTK